MASPESVLVTGGTGFLGSFVVADLVDAGYDVTAFDRSTDERRLRALGVANDVEVVGGDVSEPTDVCRAVDRSGASRIVHLAALLVDGVRRNPRAGIDVNVGGTANVLEAARTFADRVQRVVWSSSLGVYGPQETYGDRPLAEDDHVDPATLYGATKVFCEHLARHYADEYGLPVVGIRPQTVYGPYRESGTSSGLADPIETAALGEDAVMAYGDQLIDWQYVRDVARACRLATCTPASSLHRRVYNLGSTAATGREAAAELERLVPGVEVDVVDGGSLPFSARHDYSAARRDLGFDPEYPLPVGLRDYVNTVRTDAGLDPVESPDER